MRTNTSETIAGAHRDLWPPNMTCFRGGDLDIPSASKRYTSVSWRGICPGDKARVERNCRHVGRANLCSRLQDVLNASVTTLRCQQTHRTAWTLCRETHAHSRSYFSLCVFCSGFEGSQFQTSAEKPSTSPEIRHAFP
jgi:hypothetical protein